MPTRQEEIQIGYTVDTLFLEMQTVDTLFSESEKSGLPLSFTVCLQTVPRRVHETLSGLPPEAFRGHNIPKLVDDILVLEDSLVAERKRLIGVLLDGLPGNEKIQPAHAA